MEIFLEYLVWALTPKASLAECTEMSCPLGGSVALRVQGSWFISCPWPAGGAGRIRSRYRYGGIRVPVSYDPPLHNYSGSSSGHGNATPDQVRSDRETLKYVPDGLLECPEKTHHFGWCGRWCDAQGPREGEGRGVGED
jgi:hypothetical protein